MFSRKTFISVKDASKILNVTPARVYQLISEKKLILYKNKRNKILLNKENIEELNKAIKV